MSQVLALLTDHERYPITQAAREALHAGGIATRAIAGGAPEDVLAAGREAAAIFIFDSPFPEWLIAGLPACRVLARCGTGVDNIDLRAAERHGKAVTNVPAYSTHEVADHTIALLLACARKLVSSARRVSAGHWDSYIAMAPMRRLQGSTLGLFGFGKIAQETARRALAFGLRVLAYDPYLAAERIGQLGAIPVGKEQLLRESHFLSLHAALTPETHHCIGVAELALLPRGAVLINAGRGGLLDSAALLAALRSGQLAAAGLDVLESEPPAADDPLRGMEQVVITPHSASFSEAAIEELWLTATHDALRVLRGEAPLHPVVAPPAAARA
jgi:D-3-phosphoglycerate dehydrogenase / 2-oxoglutarate reductase